jgi:hypothetical protein
LYVGIYGLLISPGKGIFWYAPVLIPAMYGWRFLWEKNAAATAVAAALAGSYLLFYAHLIWWYGGGCWGPRFMVPVLPFLMLAFAALIDHGLGLMGWIAIASTTALSFFVQVVSVLVSYVPYGALMDKTPEAFNHLLWDPDYSPIIAQSEYLLHRTYPFDLAFNVYPSVFLAHLQFFALIAAVVVLVAGIVIYVFDERVKASVAVTQIG